MIHGMASNAFPDSLHFVRDDSMSSSEPDNHIKDYLYKMDHFDDCHKDDRLLNDQLQRMLRSTVSRLKRIEYTVGHGNFYLIDFDQAIKIARGYTHVGAFTSQELDFIEMIFYSDASVYGFLGKKPLAHITDRIDENRVVSVPDTGNYLYKGLAEETYWRIKKDIGDDVVLTSGIRGIPKQLYLFLNKTLNSRGNLSIASRSLAPPGYSFHGVGDFDVGQVNFGVDNFTERFISTPVYHKLCDLGYVRLRYPRENLLGVRFEPWHITLMAS